MTYNYSNNILKNLRISYPSPHHKSEVPAFITKLRFVNTLIRLKVMVYQPSERENFHHWSAEDPLITITRVVYPCWNYSGGLKVNAEWNDN